jgi:energy-coupling factor transporter transmembrane protein EcfT
VRLTLDPRAKLLILVLVNVFIITSPDLRTEAVGIGLVLLTVVCAIVGMLIGRATLKKHFEKAGIV